MKRINVTQEIKSPTVTLGINYSKSVPEYTLSIHPEEWVGVHVPEKGTPEDGCKVPGTYLIHLSLLTLGPVCTLVHVLLSL